MKCRACGADAPAGLRFCGSCGRSLVGGAAATPPSRGRGRGILIAGAVSLALLAGFCAVVMKLGRDAERSGTAVLSRPATPKPAPEPDEPCTLEVTPEKSRHAFEEWCGGGIFTLVSVKGDGRNLVAILQFSRKGYAGWRLRRTAMLDHFKSMAENGAGLNVGISLHDTNGKMIGGCVRRARETEATCNAQ